ncbi:PAS domain-containing protein [Novosphingobium sp. M1R2S20]|uniref:PAS domain-containing protein n=1 Tax=Novosphingobium rhizovicinum TaxID=3228928 RepID=A0ABV3RBY9_9SPHN
MSVRSMIENSPLAAVVSDPRLPDNPIIECNAPFLELTGYERHEVIGRNCRFLAGADTEPWLSEKMREGIRNQKPVLVEILNYRKNGTCFRNAVMIVPLFDENGELQYYLGSQVEVPKGDGYLNGSSQGLSSSKGKVAALTSRQREILIQMAEGKLNKQIAFDLGLSERTVKMHRAALFRALGVKTSADAIRIAVEAGH